MSTAILAGILGFGVVVAGHAVAYARARKGQNVGDRSA